jgi:hypothetical protein
MVRDGEAYDAVLRSSWIVQGTQQIIASNHWMHVVKRFPGDYSKGLPEVRTGQHSDHLLATAHSLSTIAVMSNRYDERGRYTADRG